MTLEIQNLIAGRWVGRPGTRRDNPARPGELTSLTAAAEPADVDTAVSAAVSAQRAWGAASPQARGAVLSAAAGMLEERIEQVAADITAEEGKTLAEARGEAARAASILRFFGSLGWAADGETLPGSNPADLIYTRREPLGVVGVITPWNFPIAIPTWKTAPALVAGNAVVLKPALIAPAGAWHLARVLAEAGLPAGVLNLVNGSGSKIGQAISDDARIAALTFTGSTAVGDHLYRSIAPRRARVQLELGGKNAVVVLDDADPEAVAAVVAAGAFGLTGQACTATSRVICTPGVKPVLLEALAAQAQRYAPGDGAQEGVLMGPVVSADQLATDRRYLQQAVADGSTVTVGGAAPDGLLLAPTVLSGVRPDDRIAREEVFGPVLAVLDAADLGEALAVLNDSSYGLSAGIVTNDLTAAGRFAREAQAGVIKINRPTSGVELNVPFGGVKDSSTNTYREQGRTALDFFTWTKSVYTGPAAWSPAAGD